MPVVQVTSGDSWEIRASLVAADGGPASPDNSFVEFVLSENQFSPPLWTGHWNSGILPYENRPGFVRVLIPREFTKTLRRGSYQFSARVADRMRSSFNTQLKGNFLVEYQPTSDQHSIPYRDDTSETFSNVPDVQTRGEKAWQDCLAPVRNGIAGNPRKAVAARDKATQIVDLDACQSGVAP